MEFVKGSVRDAAGNGFDTVTFGDLVLPARFGEQSYEKQLESIKNFQYQDHDIFICSFIKTGSHWMNNLVHFLINPGPVEQMLTVSPKLIDFFPIEKVAEQTPPRVILTHFTPDKLPSEHLEQKGKMILVTRNPRDVLVSHRHHALKHEFFDFADIEWDTFFDNWVAGKVPPGSYFNFYKKWKQYLKENNPNIILVHYENLKKNGVAELKRISEFLNVENTDERLGQILDRCSIERSKSDIESGQVKTQLVDKDGKPFIYRKGIVGDWKNHFTVAQSEIFDTLEEKFKDDIFTV
ncbi:sulfotransferase 1B1-like [Mya arenaria]|uniref:sulfotransferase 1B1-like n=1 Tax=Mya arenaria TaxID=6604 RepID=UPI0022E42F48|nr:sulfotransferase 1B1-like [Mya arenaria]XP_052788286.1 sulfotransferase 1B1-like [Mya arenaria]XP_052788287.1 sulfotransferase 1B1-like [Mya arenaria]XP_052788288.1 sulfotransferase 1B1-like [Mya arenaria]XP_052788289.1 sulfotransferase 1B1-like [Mya arenaria]